MGAAVAVQVEHQNTNKRLVETGVRPGWCTARLLPPKAWMHDCILLPNLRSIKPCNNPLARFSDILRHTQACPGWQMASHWLPPLHRFQTSLRTHMRCCLRDHNLRRPCICLNLSAKSCRHAAILRWSFMRSQNLYQAHWMYRILSGEQLGVMPARMIWGERR